MLQEARVSINRGLHKMRKTIFFILSLLLMGMIATTVSAANCVNYKGMPTPYTIKGHVELHGELVGGVKVNIQNLETGCSEEVTTNNKGFFVTDINNLGTLDSRRAAGQYGDIIRATVLGNCGADDICVLDEEMYGDGNDYDISFEFDLKTTKFPYLAVTITAIISALLAIAVIVLKRFKWGRAFGGLVNYYRKLGDEALRAGRKAEANKHYARAAKMVKTAIKREQEGKYDK